MTAIKSLYIPHVEMHFNAGFIAGLFSKNGLSQVSKVYLKTRHSCNHAYIEIDSWHETEAAYSFIKRLRNPSTEARLVYSDDNWWVVNINNTFKFTSNNRVLTVFTKPTEAVEFDDDCSNVAVGCLDQEDDDEMVTIDAEKTKALRNIILKFKENYERHLMKQEEVDTMEFEAYLREMDWMRNAYRREISTNECDLTFWY
jgi:transposase-like protein